MAQLPEIIQYDQTLKSVEKAIETEAKTRPPGHALGAGEIGEDCQRKLWYKFRTVDRKNFPAKTILIFESGHRSEEEMAKKLRLLPYIELYTEDPERVKDPNAHNKQIGVKAHMGHFKAYLDGMIHGIVEAPKTWHTWENKCVKQESFNDFIKLREKHGVKNTVENWNYKYHCQVIIGLHLMQITRNFFTVTTPGVRDWASCRIAEDKKLGETLFEKAHSIIFDGINIPARYSQKSDSQTCRFCDYVDVCHNNKIPLVNCKTCRYIKPVQNGEWECQKTGKIIQQFKLLLSSCNSHIFNKALLPDNFEFLENQEGCMVFKTHTGLVVANCDQYGFPNDASVSEIFTSNELYNDIQNWQNIKKDIIKKVVKMFDGEVVSEKKYEGEIKGL